VLKRQLGPRHRVYTNNTRKESDANIDPGKCYVGAGI